MLSDSARGPAYIEGMDIDPVAALEALPDDDLHLSEAEAFRRITVARAARRCPALLTALVEGRVHLSGLALLVPLITADNCEAVLERAAHRSKREIEELVAELAPRPAVAGSIRKLPRRGSPAVVPPAETRDLDVLGGDKPDELFPGTVGAAPAIPTVERTARPALAPLPAQVEPLSPARYRVQFTASAELKNKLERLAALMRREIPNGDLAAIIEGAVTEKLERLEARHFGKTTAPRKALADSNTSARSRHVPAAVRRAVHERDEGRCAFVDGEGRRCSERLRLELHHRHPFAMGGDHRASNVGLLCSAHNRYMAERDFGRAAIHRHSEETQASLEGGNRTP
jgi:5-methylcytosine-specific restriction endonuclease McrA